MRMIHNALELYFVKHENYPSTQNWEEFEAAINLNLGAAVIPNDPIYPKRTYEYRAACVNNKCAGYALKALLDDCGSTALKQDTDGIVLGLDCNDPAYCTKENTE